MNYKQKARDIYAYFFDKHIPVLKSYYGVNCFFNQSLFPSNNLKRQGDDIRNTLNLKFVRVLFNWNDGVQKSKASPIDFSFYDSIIQTCTDSSLNALIVINGFPQWLKNEQSSFLTEYIKYCQQIIERYKNNPHVIGWQIGNEINTAMFEENTLYGFVNNPSLYIHVLSSIYDYSKRHAPAKLVCAAATTSIIQNFPNTLNYNKELCKLGLDNFCDVIAIHYYGNSPWALLKPDGVLDFMRQIRKPILITEVGAKEKNKHVDILKKDIAFLFTRCRIAKIFWYQYDAGGDTASYGLRTPQGVVSDVYDYLKNLK